MDIWGFCSDCRTWFPCPTWFDRTSPQPSCPTCHSEPSAIENRARDRVDLTQVRVEADDGRVLVTTTPSDLWLG